MIRGSQGDAPEPTRDRRGGLPAGAGVLNFFVILSAAKNPAVLSIYFLWRKSTWILRYAQNDRVWTAAA
jgi:hypothetical protein